MNEDLIKERKKLGISVQQFAKICGYSPIWIYLFERGEKKVSKRFLTAYSEAIENYKKILK